ncbi:MAG: hypothetical protein OEY64_01840 [Nitrospinota bacterium]|nr:hypothetical protein [Nitrospinota bacterium]
MFWGRKDAKWWPHYLLTLSGVMVVVLIIVSLLATLYPVPDDAPMVIPMPDDGENVPGPEWVFLLFWMPFWYFKGRMKKYLVFMTVIPILALIFFILLPYLDKLPLAKYLGKIPKLNSFMESAKQLPKGIKRSFIYGIPALAFALVLGFSFVATGHQAKILGCDSCHNPAMGHRMAIPPIDVFNYYMVDRARQIGVGKYRAGKESLEGNSGRFFQDTGDTEGGYKDANWQMRHMYEPTFTW